MAISILIHSGTGMTRCWTVRHSGIKKKTLYEVKRDTTPYTSPLQAMDWDTPCTSIVMAVERDTLYNNSTWFTVKDHPNKRGLFVEENSSICISELNNKFPGTLQFQIGRDDHCLLPL
jgi:hypothetical protein